MIGAHTPSGGAAVRSHGRRRVLAGPRGAEAGFTIIEIVIVVLILAILMAIALPSVRSAADGPAAPSTAIAGGTVWRSVQQWRLENGGTMPATSMLTNYGAGLVDPAGVPMVQPWPETQRGARIVLTAGSGAAPPATGTPNSLAYAANGDVGWLAGYGPKGRLVFRRVIAPSTTPGAPAG